MKIKQFMLFFLLLPYMSFGFPVLVSSKDLPYFYGTSRDRLMAFSFQGKEFQIVPLQVDELESDSFLVLRNLDVELPVRKKVAHPGKNDPFRGSLGEVHRLSFSSHDFTKCDKACEKLAQDFFKTQCGSQTDVLAKIELIDSNAVFLGSCGRVVPSKPKTTAVQVSSQRYSTGRYEVETQADSPILFKEFSLKNHDSKVAMLGSTFFFAAVKPRFFLPLDFKAQDLRLAPTGHSSGTLSTAVELTMAAKFFGISAPAQVCCDVSAYQDALYFPIQLDMPFSASSLRAGSGVFIGFEFKGAMSDFSSNIPRYSDKGKGDTSKNGSLRFKNGDNLLFVKIKNKSGKKESFPKFHLLAEDFPKVNVKDSTSTVALYVDLGRKTNEDLVNLEVWFYAAKTDEEQQLQRYFSADKPYFIKPL